MEIMLKGKSEDFLRKTGRGITTKLIKGKSRERNTNKGMNLRGI